MLPNSVVQDSSVYLQPIVVVKVISIDSVQQHVRLVGGEVRQICALFLGGGELPLAQIDSNYTLLGGPPPPPSYYPHLISYS